MFLWPRQSGLGMSESNLFKHSPRLPIFIRSYAKSIGAIHMHTSAKLNKGLDDIFQRLAASMLFFGTVAISMLNACSFLQNASKAGLPSLERLADLP